MSTNIMVRRSDGVVHVVLNRPESKNAMLPEMWSELAEHFNDIENRCDDRVLVLQGEGGSFCSGADIGARWSPTSDPSAVLSPPELLAGVKRCILALTGMTKPTVAAVDGVAVGGGCNLALACDLVVATHRARFSQIFVRRGLTVDTGGSWMLPRLVGDARARRMILLGEVLDAAHAYQLGLLTHVVPTADLDQEVAAITTRLVESPAVVLAADKKLLAEAATLTLAEALDRETRAQLDMLSRPHVADAMRAFLARQQQTSAVSTTTPVNS